MKNKLFAKYVHHFWNFSFLSKKVYNNKKSNKESEHDI